MDFATPAQPASSANGQHTDGLPDLARFDVLWAQLALIGIVVSFCNAIVYYPLRLGLFTPPLLVPGCVLVVSAALLSPLLLTRCGIFANNDLRSVAMPVVTLLSLAGLLLAFLLGKLLLPIYLLIALAGAWRAFKLLRTQDWLQIAFCLCVGLLVGLYLFGTVQGLNYAGLYTPEQAQLGVLNHDTTFHASIAYMIQNFGVPSTAVDGILPVKYHFGSHFLFAALGLMAGSQPLYSYGAGVPIILAPMVVTVLLLAAVAMDRGRKPLGAYLLFGLGLVFLSDLIGWNSYYISESYSCGIIGLMLLLPLLALVAEGSVLSSRQTMVAAFVMIAAIPVLTVSKISVGVLWTAALGWIILRHYRFRSAGLFVGLVAAAVLFLVMRALSPSKGDYQTLSSSAVIPFFFFRLYGIKAFSSFLIPLILLLTKTHWYGGDGLRSIFSRKPDLVFEVVMIVLILGSIPPLIGYPQDSAVWYFLNVAQWIAMALLIVRFAPVSGFSGNLFLARAFPVVAILFFSALALIWGVYQQASSIAVIADKGVNGQLLGGKGQFKYWTTAFKHEHVIWGKAFHEAMASDPHAQLAQTVRAMIPGPDKHAAVFVAPGYEAFWSKPDYCLAKYNVQVSLTGQPSLLGGPPASYHCPRDAYTSRYGAHFESRQISDADLCAHARERDIQRVVIIDGDRQPARSLSCAL